MGMNSSKSIPFQYINSKLSLSNLKLKEFIQAVESYSLERTEVVSGS